MSENAQPQRVNAAARAERLVEEMGTAIMKGHADPPNDVVAMFTKKANEVRGQIVEVRRELDETKKRLGDLGERVIRLKGAHDSYVDDIHEALLHHVQSEMAEETTDPPLEVVK